MKKFLPFSRRQPSLDRYTVNKGGWGGSDRFNGKSMRRTSATSLSTRSIQVVRGAYNIDLNKVDSSFTKLHRACLLNDDTQVRKHLHKVDNNSHDSSNRYPIHLATVNGNFAIVKLLIENHANPNVQDNEGNTPLIKSIECRHEHLVKYLLSNGADPNISDLDGNTALHWAIMTESIIAVDALMTSKKCDLTLRNNKDENCLHLAVRCPLINTLTYETLIMAGLDLEAKDQFGFTALEIAQTHNNKTAINAFNRCREKDLIRSLDSANNTPSKSIERIDDCPIVASLSPNANATTTATITTAATTNQGDIDYEKCKMCEEYKLKYITKNRENLEYETKLIQLTAKIERLTLDMSYMREQTERLESENSRLKTENSNFLEQISKSKQKENGPTAHQRNQTMKLGIGERRHERFLAAKALGDERVNKLKCELTPPN